MGRYICVVSGKGGVGKTTAAVSIAHSMSKHKKILLVDANITTPNINIHLGAPLLRKTLMSVLRGESALHEAIYSHPSGIKVLPSITGLDDLRMIDYDKLKKALKSLEEHADIILLDAAAGLGKEAITAIESCDEALIITNPELSSVLDAQRTIQVAHALRKTILGVVINKTRAGKHTLKTSDVERLLGIPVISVVPYDKNIAKALLKGSPVTHTHPRSKASKSYEEISCLLLGKAYFKSTNKKSQLLYDYTLKQLGLK